MCCASAALPPLPQRYTRFSDRNVCVSASTACSILPRNASSESRCSFTDTEEAIAAVTEFRVCIRVLGQHFHYTDILHGPQVSQRAPASLQYLVVCWVALVGRCFFLDGNTADDIDVYRRLLVSVQEGIEPQKEVLVAGAEARLGRKEKAGSPCAEASPRAGVPLVLFETSERVRLSRTSHEVADGEIEHPHPGVLRHVHPEPVIAGHEIFCRDRTRLFPQLGSPDHSVLCGGV